MSEIGEMWAGYKEERIAKRAQNRMVSARILFERGIIFSEHNDGAHLVITGIRLTRLSSTVDGRRAKFNSGVPMVLIAYGNNNLRALRACGLGFVVESC